MMRFMILEIKQKKKIKLMKIRPTGIKVYPIKKYKSTSTPIPKIFLNCKNKGNKLKI